MTNIIIDSITYCNTETASKWLGIAQTTLRGKQYQETLTPIRIGRQLWWPLDKVLNLDRQQFDRRYTRKPPE